MDALSALTKARLGLAMLCQPLHDGQPCGDAAAAFDAGEGASLLVLIDGLGHGPQAARAAQAAVGWLAAQAALGALREQSGSLLVALLRGLDDALIQTRGAAVGLALVHQGAAGPSLAFAGVGNTRAMRWRGAALHRLPSQYGIVGGGLPQAPEVHTLDLAPGDWLLMFSDGIDENLHLPAALPEWQRDPALLCQHLAQRFPLGADDRGVLACRVPPASMGSTATAALDHAGA